MRYKACNSCLNTPLFSSRQQITSSLRSTAWKNARDSRENHISASSSTQQTDSAPRYPCRVDPPSVLTPSEISSSALPGSRISSLSLLPFPQVLRTYLITAISSSPRLLDASSAILRRMLDSRSFLFNIDKNPVARTLLLKTFYKQFCAGSTAEQVDKTCRELRQQGYGGVILEYALEVLRDTEGDEATDVAVWRAGMLDTITMTLPGDFVALKWSGMGPAALRLCAAQRPPSKRMDEAMKAVCTAAAKKNVNLLPSAEEGWNLPGYHAWTLDLQRMFNRDGKAVVYNTYQCYLRSAPATVAHHLKIASQEGFTFGAKLVRGAYLNSEDRNVVQPTIEATHAAFDGVMTALIERKHNDVLRPTLPDTMAAWPSTSVMLATHNAKSVQLAQRLRQEQASRGEELTPLAYSQLQGMADEVSCALLGSAGGNCNTTPKIKEQVFKFIPWGNLTECLNYLLRRAAENKDAAMRTADTRKAMGSEVWRRFRSVIGLV